MRVEKRVELQNGDRLRIQGDRHQPRAGTGKLLPWIREDEGGDLRESAWGEEGGGEGKEGGEGATRLGEALDVLTVEVTAQPYCPVQTGSCENPLKGEEKGIMNE